VARQPHCSVQAEAVRSLSSFWSARGPKAMREVHEAACSDANLLSATNQRTHATAETLNWQWDGEHGIPLEQMSPADAERLLRLLQAPACLEDHHVRDLLKRFAPRWPELVARHPSAPLVPSATAGRPIGRGNEELSPGAARQAALRHPSRSGVRGYRHGSGSRQSPGGGIGEDTRQMGGGSRCDNEWH
jgi:hypothetical protein